MTIELRHLSVGYKGKSVVADINANLEAGRLVCLIGKNGAGKSTLLRTIVGLLPELEGEVLLDNRSARTIKPKEMATLIGVVLTDHSESQDITVRELVSMGRLPYTDFWGTLSKADADVVENVMEQVGIASLSQCRISGISDGERQKALIAKVLAQATPVILLDEPTSFLDFTSKVEFMEMLRSLAHDKGKTILVTTHDVSLANHFADVIWLMEKESVIVSPTETQLIDFVGEEAAKYL